MTIDELDQTKTDKGAWLYFKASASGKTIEELIPHIVEKALDELPIPKPMRWGNNDVEFVRPIHWVVLMYGSNIVTCQIKNLTASNITFGHRFHAPAPIALKHANEYEDALMTAKVIADFQKRKSKIEQQLEDITANNAAVVDYEQTLL